MNECQRKKMKKTIENWQQGKSKLLCKTIIADVNEIEYTNPKGITKPYIILDAPDWVITVPVLKKDTEDAFVMVAQWRHGAKASTIEFPGGVIEKNENAEEAGKRELLEETGFLAHKMIHLGTMWTNPAIMANKVHFFAAMELEDTKKTNLDEDEFLALHIESKKKVYSSMGTEPYTHALMGTALHLFRQHCDEKI